MRTFFDQYSQQIFSEQWYTMAELLLYKKREQVRAVMIDASNPDIRSSLYLKDAERYAKHSRDVFKNSFFDGKLIMSNADVKEVMSILNTAGFKGQFCFCHELFFSMSIFQWMTSKCSWSRRQICKKLVSQS